MNKVLNLFLILFSATALAQPRSNYGPNIGWISNSEKFNKSEFEIGFSVRRINKFIYAQPEVNLVWDIKNRKLTEMRIPFLFGVRFFKTVRVNVGGELRSKLIHQGFNNMGLNSLTYTSDPTFGAPVVGFGLDLDKLCFDYRMTYEDKNWDIPQWTFSVSYLFGPRK
jgi:hypothetical protein